MAVVRLVCSTENGVLYPYVYIPYLYVGIGGDDVLGPAKLFSKTVPNVTAHYLQLKKRMLHCTILPIHFFQSPCRCKRFKHIFKHHHGILNEDPDTACGVSRVGLSVCLAHAATFGGSDFLSGSSQSNAEFPCR